MTYKCGVMKSTTQLEKENLVLVGKCLLLPGEILFVIGFVLRLSTIDGILFLWQVSLPWYPALLS